MAMDSRTKSEAIRNRDVTDMDPDSREEKRARKARRVLSAGTLSGDRVRNSAGEDLGKIEELMIDVPTGRIAYAVLSFGGFLGMGNKLFAIPWEALTVDEIERQFILDVDKKTLENAPGFDKDEWPDMSDASFGTKVFSHYGYKPYWEEPGVAGESTPVRERPKTRGGGGAA